MTSLRIVRRGLLIGINYTGTESQLNGCVNDTENLKTFLINQKYFNPNELICMTDNQTGLLSPTKNNIMSQLEGLVIFSREHTNELVNIFLSYSGHGSSIEDTSGDEEDGLDEVLCPLDYQDNGYIVDDDLKRLIDQLGPNVLLTVLIDACHSGTALDLKYNYLCDSKNRCLVTPSSSETQCQVLLISGCRDDQTSADACLPDQKTKVEEYQGAMTGAFLSVFRPSMTSLQLVEQMRRWLKVQHFAQIPQLSSGRYMNLGVLYPLGVYNQIRGSIKSASYGKYTRIVDVTNLVKKQMKSGTKTLKVSNRLFGDPCVGVVKSLDITTTDDRHLSCCEGQVLRLDL
jgi:hypothetical protein